MSVNSQIIFLRANIVTSKSYFINETLFKFFFVVSSRIKFKSRYFSSNLIVFSSIETFVNNQLLIDFVVNNFVSFIINEFIEFIINELVDFVINSILSKINNLINQVVSNFVNQEIFANFNSRSQFEMTINDWQNIEFS